MSPRKGKQNLAFLQWRLKDSKNPLFSDILFLLRGRQQGGKNSEFGGVQRPEFMFQPL